MSFTETPNKQNVMQGLKTRTDQTYQSDKTLGGNNRKYTHDNHTEELNKTF